jgi:glycosyltransferase involved in cell wall biosynthesis
VFPSHQEGLAIALMEAMASGLPCLASDIRGNVDLLKNSKYLFEPNDYDKVAELMKALTKENMDVEVRRNQEVIELYDIKNVVCELKNIYIKYN